MLLATASFLFYGVAMLPGVGCFPTQSAAQFYDLANESMMRPPFGVLVVDKPSGITSRSITNRIHGSVAKQLQTTKRKVKVGHVGTLDPLASGVLLLTVGPATRLSNLLHEAPKTYVGTFRFGMISDTDDIDGTCRVVDAPSVSREQIESVLPQFIGSIEQIPPAFSAKRVSGKRAYDLARAGHEVDLEPVRVDIDTMTVLSFDDDHLTIEVTCGSGTYIRSIGRDLARACGSEAVMTALRRTQSGSFAMTDAKPLNVIEADPLSHLICSFSIVRDLLPTVTIPRVQKDNLRNGRLVNCEEKPRGDHGQCDGPLRVAVGIADPQTDDDEELIAICELRDGWLQPRLVFRRD